jgi:hypothetical protein
MSDTKIKVIYSTRCLGTVGTQSENDSFTSIDEAKTAPLPEGADFAFIKTKNGCLVYQAPFGWQEYVKNEQ